MVLLCSVCVVLLNVPRVQQYFAEVLSESLSRQLGTSVQVENVQLGLFNRVIVDGVSIKDQQQQDFFSATRLSAKLAVTSLLQGKLHFDAAQLFGMELHLRQDSLGAVPNFQFLLDSLASDGGSDTPLDLRIGSVVLRNGHVAYDRMDVPLTEGILSPHHVEVSKVSGRLMLSAINEDSLNVQIRNLSFVERSGLRVKNIKAQLKANRHSATLQDFQLQLPNSLLSLPRVTASYRATDEGLDFASLRALGTISMRLASSDFSFMGPRWGQLAAVVEGDIDWRLDGKRLEIVNARLRDLKSEARLSLKGFMDASDEVPAWSLDLDQLILPAPFTTRVVEVFDTYLPDKLVALGTLKGVLKAKGEGGLMEGKGQLTTQVGSAEFDMAMHGRALNGHVTLNDADLSPFFSPALKLVAGRVEVNSDLHNPQTGSWQTKLDLSGFTVDNYAYREVSLEGTLNGTAYETSLTVNDDNLHVQAEARGSVGRLLPFVEASQGEEPTLQLTARVPMLAPHALKLLEGREGEKYSFDLAANLTGATANTLHGTLDVYHPVLVTNSQRFSADNLHVMAEAAKDWHSVTMKSGESEIRLRGDYDYNTLLYSFSRIMQKHLPEMPGLPTHREETANQFGLYAYVTDAAWFRIVTGRPLYLHEPFVLDMRVDDQTGHFRADASMPSAYIGGGTYENVGIHVATLSDSLVFRGALDKVSTTGGRMQWRLNSAASNNVMLTDVHFDNNNALQLLRGTLRCESRFFMDHQHTPTAYVKVLPSDVEVGDSLWTFRPGSVLYRDNHLEVHNLTLEADGRSLSVNGRATNNPADTLTVNLRDIDVRYILDFVDFHSVDFDGRASGRVVASGLFSPQPFADARLTVRDFAFEQGRMGVLSAHASLDNEVKHIVIDAVAREGMEHYTLIKGYISPWNDDMRLDIAAHDANAGFLQGLCGSFMSDVQASADGEVCLAGPLSALNITGELTLEADLTLTNLNTRYHLSGGSVHLKPNEIVLDRLRLHDYQHGSGVLTGALTHVNLKRLRWDLNAQVEKMLVYNFPDFEDELFCGTVYASGNCRIRGGYSEVTIDLDVTPTEGTVFRYNADKPETWDSSDYLVWTSRDNDHKVSAAEGTVQSNGTDTPELEDDAMDLRINFLINATPDAALNIVMDAISGDNITLHGHGSLRASYYNKGAFELYGNYMVDRGLYRLTVQNVLRRDFDFLSGGTISFGGNPLQAGINLQAKHTINAVSLSELNVGRSFTNNNVRVDCLMNITGTPDAPRVDFDLDMPTLGSDAKQMALSLIDSEEEKNQQVIYLLAVGRFYAASGTNSNASHSQTTLAMQSILSGTISRQINGLLDNVIKNDNWDFGANISTGDEGWNNAQYEGLLSGRMLNNRLLFNGEFGYRDNANATSSFIGDFNLRYLLVPNGNISLNVYNQTNDRYFTTSTLTTQGLGFIFKTDFDSWRQFLFRRKK